MSEQNPLFRKAALDKLASPERLDVLMHVTSPKGWAALMMMGVILSSAVVWRSSRFEVVLETAGSHGCQRATACKAPRQAWQSWRRRQWGVCNLHNPQSLSPNPTLSAK